MPQSTSLPRSTARLLAHYGDGKVELPRHKVFLIGRLLEEGDTREHGSHG